MTTATTAAEAAAGRPVLYHYWRSSSSWRVRWALRHKGVAHDLVAVNLLEGQQQGDAHKARNPAQKVPVLLVGGAHLAESVAIIEYLEEAHPAPPLLPSGALPRARVRQLVETINAGTQPLQNLSVLRCVSADAAQQRAWAQHHIRLGLSAYEVLLEQDGRPLDAVRFSHGDSVTMADLFLLPQVYNARRQGLDVAQWPRVARIEAACLQLDDARLTSPDHLGPG